MIEMQAANEDPYAPIPSKILSVRDETSDIRTFEFEQKIPAHKPGQIVQMTDYGVGEAPISISSSQEKL
ncbi:MAG: oxidoreductase, partial [Candidatus Micrarchaeota archaeon]|nr:oxidoreductase [Candidatus Micrarchaeota archaeon]